MIRYISIDTTSDHCLTLQVAVDMVDLGNGLVLLGRTLDSHAGRSAASGRGGGAGVM